jgi:exodeoxyribonuclease VII large subunit
LVVPDRRELVGRVAQLGAALASACRSLLRRDRLRVESLARQLRDPRQTLRAERLRIDELGERARRAIEGTLRLAREQLRGAASKLQALSPLAVLERGYSITRRLEDGVIVRAAAELSAGERVEITFREGRTSARVEQCSD